MERTSGAACAALLLVSCTGGGLSINPKSGYVSVLSDHLIFNGMIFDDASASAQFGLRRDAAIVRCATRSTFGPCTLYSSCSTPDLDGGVFVDAGVAMPDAGQITIVGPLLTQVLRPDTFTPYMDDHPGQRMWTGGDSISISAAGGTVPAFQGIITGPPEITFTAPAITHSNPSNGLPVVTLSIDRSKDLAFTWSKTSKAQIRVGLTGPATQTTEPGAELDCSFDGAAAMATIPSSALQAMPAGMGGFVITAFNSDDVRAGDWSITLSAESVANAPDGAPLGGTAVFN